MKRTPRDKMSSTTQAAMTITMLMTAVMASIGQLFHPQTSVIQKASHLTHGMGALASHYLPGLF